MKKLLFTSALLLAAAAGYAQCTPALSAAPAPSGNDLLRQQFTNASTFAGNGNTCTIRFGDGAIQYNIGAIVTHSYSAPGAYVATLYTSSYDSATNTLACSDSLLLPVTVAYPCAGSTLTGSVAGNVLSYTIATPGSAGSPVTCSLDLGNGTTIAASASGTYTYPIPGSYTATLTAVGTAGSCSYATSMPVVISSWGSGSGCTGNHAGFVINPDFFADADFPDLHDIYAYNTSTTGTGVLGTATWYWNDPNGYYPYGAEYPDPMEIAWYEYADTGTYTVTLVQQWVDSMTGNVICTDTAQQAIHVTDTLDDSAIHGRIWQPLEGYWDTTIGGYPDYYMDSINVLLVRYDATAGTLTLAAEEHLPPITGSCIQYYFANVPAGTYFVKAVPYFGPGNTTAYPAAPTYGDSSLYWNTATAINWTGYSTSHMDVQLLSGTAVGSGSGFISGSVSMGAGKNTGTGVPNALVYLETGAGAMVAFTYTDANGNYGFAGLPLGTYRVHPEEMSFTTTNFDNIDITASAGSLSAISFERHPQARTITPVGTGIATPGKSSFMLWPNPAHGYTTLSWADTRMNGAAYSICAANGQVVCNGSLAGNGSQRISTAMLPPGVYMLRLGGSGLSATMRLLVQ